MSEEIKKRTKLRQLNSQAILLKNLGNLVTTLIPTNNLPFIGGLGRPVGANTNPGMSGSSALLNYGGPPETLVGVAANSDALGPFLNAPTDMLGQLTPKLKFSFSTTDKNGVVDEQIFNFSDHTDSDRVMSLAKAKLQPEPKINTFLGAGTKGTDVGVQEFRWVWDNKHQGDRTIKAHLSLYFGSVTELLNQSFLRFIFQNKNQIDQALSSKPKPKNKKTKESERKEVQEMFKAAWRFSGQTSVGRAVPTPAPKSHKGYSQLKVAIGWSAPLNLKKNHAGWTSDDYKKFMDGVEATQKVIALQLISYRLNFEQEGQVVLDLEYVGSLDQVYSDDTYSNIFNNSNPASFSINPNNRPPPDPANMPVNVSVLLEVGYFNNDYVHETAYSFDELGVAPLDDVFNPSPNLVRDGPLGIALYERSKAAYDAFAQGLTPNIAQFAITQNELEFEIETLKKYLDYIHKYESSISNYVDLTEKIEKGISVAQRLLKRVKNEVRNRLYSKFVDYIFRAGRVFYYPVRIASLDSERPPIASQLSINDPRAVVARTSPVTGQDVADARTRFRTALERFADPDNPIDYTEDSADVKILDPGTSDTGVANTPEGLQQTRIYTPDDNERFIYYVRLGDIIGCALNGVDRIPGFSSDVLLGSIIPSTWQASKIPEGASIPIASLPISLEHFTQWFVENISGPKVTQMSFRNFIDRLLNKLVAPVLNQTVLSAEDDNRIVFEMTSLTSPYNVKDLVSHSRNWPVPGYIPNITALRKVFPSQKSAQGRRIDSIRNAQNYYLVIVAGQVNKDKIGSKLVDEANGIYHLVLGSDRGLVKTYSFSEKKMPFLRAMHIENNSTGMALILPQDVELTMVGNCIFRNGNVIYVNADFAFGREIGAQLGLGGYYKVVKSDNVIRSGKFETRLTCMFERRADSVPVRKP